MSDNTSAANEALASLGLTAAAATEEVAPVAEVVEAGNTEAVAEAPAEATEEKSAGFTAGDVEDLSFDDVPAMERGFSSTRTKYGLEDIAAPGTDGKKYHGKLVRFEGGEQIKFKRSVQSAATGQNSKAKDAGAPNYYVTRTAEKDGVFQGMYVIRTDVRTAVEAPAEAEAAE